MKNTFVIILLFSSLNLRASDLPDLVRCNLSNTHYQLILVLKSPSLPSALTAIGLKRAEHVLFKVTSQMTAIDANTVSFVESPATVNSKEVKLNLISKKAILSKFHYLDLKDNSEFLCNY